MSAPLSSQTDPARGALLGRKPSPYVVLSSLLLIVSALLRFHDLGERSLWYDEAVAANNSRGYVSQTIENTRYHNSSPIIYPLILNLVQKAGSTAGSVRLPSALFSLLAVLVVLGLPGAGVDRRTAFIAATLLGISAAQIRYAQEVREYSLSVLFAALMIYGLLAFLHSDGRKRIGLYTALFFAPLIQYGLVLFGCAVVGTMGLASLQRRRPFIKDVVQASLALGAGSMISLILTLRYQWSHTSNTYLRQYFYDGSLLDAPGVIAFLGGQAYSLLTYLMLHGVVFGVFLAAFGIYAWRFSARPHSAHELALFLVAYLIAAAASLIHAYPFGAIRQCLYLAPVTALVFGGAMTAVADSLRDRQHLAWIGMVMLVIIVFGTQTLRAANPYREVEDIKSVVSGLDAARRPHDVVYVYHGSGPALSFYGVWDERFILGNYHGAAQRYLYLEEIEAAMNPDGGRLWIVISHAAPGVEEYVVSRLPSAWTVEKAVDANRASLYLAEAPRAGHRPAQ